MNYRRHHARGLQSSMMLLWACAGCVLGIYNISRGSRISVALKIQAQILMVLSLVTWGQCGYYKKGWSIGKCVAVVIGLGAIMGGIEVGVVFALKSPINRGVTWPLTFMAVLSAVLLAAGVLRHYIDIYQTRSVRGISFLFVGIDAMGDLTSLLSLVFEPRFDILGSVIYGTELVLWIGVMLCGLVLGRGPNDNELPVEQQDSGITPHSRATDVSATSSAISVFRTVSGLREFETSADNELPMVRLRTETS